MYLFSCATTINYPIAYVVLMAFLETNDWTYSGNMVNGKRSGFGKCTWHNGITYEGEWDNDQRCGNGIQIGPRGTLEGFFLDDTYVGKLTIVSVDGLTKKPKDLKEAFTKTVRIVEPNGDIYTGTWFGGQKNGYGLQEIHGTGIIHKGFFLNNHYLGQVYIIDENGKHRKVPFHNGVFDGDVWVDYATGGTYHGSWKNGKRDGFGTMKWPNGNEYIGTWINDQKSGSGCKYIFDYGIYEGDFENNQFEGYGQIAYQDKVSFKGNFKNGVREGEGSLRYPDGIKCKGVWKNGKRYGEFTYSFANKSVFSGTFNGQSLVGKAIFTSSFGFSINVSFDKNQLKHTPNSGIMDDGALALQSEDDLYRRTLIELYFVLIDDVMFYTPQTELTTMMSELSNHGYTNFQSTSYNSHKYGSHWNDDHSSFVDRHYFTSSGQTDEWDWRKWS